MAKVFDHLNDDIKAFIHEQRMFFVGTAPVEGDINLSPKGYDTLKIVGDNRLNYLDYYGSGNETAIHIEENQRITFMWCSFDEKPNIVRVYGKGKVIAKDSIKFSELHSSLYSDYPIEIIRQIFDVKIDRVQTSCGWGVPYMSFVGDRQKLHEKSIAAFLKSKR